MWPEIGAENRLGTVIGSEGGSFDFAMASPRFYFTGDDEWAFAFALPRTRIQLKKTQQEKQTNKQEREQQTRKRRANKKQG